jgi:hypothetical protein
MMMLLIVVRACVMERERLSKVRVRGKHARVAVES